MESIITYGIIYLLVFRLAVLLLGGLCIFCGYRLFLGRRQRAGGAVGLQNFSRCRIASGMSRVIRPV